MSLKTLRLLGLLLLAGLAALFGPRFLALAPDLAAQVRHGEGESSLTYTLARDTWTRFALPPATRQVRLLINANLATAEPVQESVNYTLIWRFREAGGTIVDQGSAAFRVKTYGGCHRDCAVEIDHYYAHLKLQPLEGNRLQIALSQQMTGTLELRLGDGDAAVVSAAARVYIPNREQSENPGAAWKELDRKDRDRLKQENALGTLTPDEQENLMRQSFRPLGPSGMRNRDYTVARLFQREQPRGRVCRQAPELKEVDQEATRLRVWPLAPEQTLRWRLSGKSPVDFRLDLRSKRPGQVRWRFLDQAGQALGRGARAINAGGDSGDRLSHGDEPVASAEKLYLSLPPKAVIVELESDQALYCNAWVRPRDLPFRKTFGTEESQDHRQPLWFSLLPLGSPHSAFILLATEPLDKRIDQEPLGVVDLKPNQDWLGRHVLLPRAADDLPVNAPLGSVFTRVQPERPFTPGKVGIDQDQRPTTLLVQNLTTQPVSLDVVQDGRNLLEETLTARAGSFLLELSPEAEKPVLRSSTKRINAWINHRRPKARYMRRKLAVRLEDALSYTIHKQEQTRLTLSARLLHPVADQALVVRARVRANTSGASDSYTVPLRQADFSTKVAPSAVMPDVARKKIVEHRPWHITLDNDLPAGAYTLIIEKVSGPDAYLLLSQPIYQKTVALNTRGLGEEP